MNTKKFLFSFWSVFVTLLILMAIVNVSTGCANRGYIQVDLETIHDTLYTSKARIDSVYFHDSIFTVVDTIGHPIYKELWHTKYVYKQNTDTVYKNNVQYKTKQITQTKEVKKNSKFANFCIWFFWILVIIAMLYVAWKVFVKYYLPRLNK